MTHETIHESLFVQTVVSYVNSSPFICVPSARHDAGVGARPEVPSGERPRSVNALLRLRIGPYLGSGKVIFVWEGRVKVP